MSALDLIVRQGKALYVGISNYGAEESKKAIAILRELGTPCLIHQMSYSMFNRRPEDGLLSLLKAEGVGRIAFSPLAKGLLTDRYLNGIPVDSRAAGGSIFLNPHDITAEKIATVQRLNELATARGQSLAQMALAWLLRGGQLTAVLIGASKVSQIEDCVGALENLDFTGDELEQIEEILA
jgi:L-glyceraldehyde 3-phosphate reductase